jgi:hypothetical protein
MLLLLLHAGEEAWNIETGTARGEAWPDCSPGASWESGRLAGHQDFAAEMVGSALCIRICCRRQGQAGRAGCQRIEKIGEGSPQKIGALLCTHNSTQQPPQPQFPARVEGKSPAERQQTKGEQCDICILVTPGATRWKRIEHVDRPERDNGG